MYLAFDSETGGIGDVSLLTVYFSLLDKDLNEIDSLSLALKENDGKPYRIEPEAMEINKINLLEHNRIAIPYSAGGQELFKKLSAWTDKGKIKLTPVGHNIHFDINGITDNLLGRKTWNQFVSYKVVDTQTFARCLQIGGVLPGNMSISLGTLIGYFCISLPGVQHEAKYDTLATVEVLKCLLKLQ